jgi:ABC-type Zn uptake system ZnuABC Zn-binding protein ZnuA
MKTIILCLTLLTSVVGAAEPLKVVCSVPELGALAREIGGDDVAVTVCVKPREDPHALEARPSLVRDLASADAWVQMGLDLEVGWAPKLLDKARNPKLAAGKHGFIDGASVIVAHRHAGPVDRSMGDVHPAGNPHYLVDPVNGLKVAELLANRFGELRPESAESFTSRLASFREALSTAMVGPELAAKYPADKLAVLAAAGTLQEFLTQSQETAPLGGWSGAMQAYHGRELAADHDAWVYFTDRFGLTVTIFLEPKPGMSPTTRHLTQVVNAMKERNIQVLITSPYFAARHHQFVARAADATLAPLANQVDSRSGTSTYIQMVDYNVRTLAAALEARAP